jgi:hypothetical protein
MRQGKLYFGKPIQNNAGKWVGHIDIDIPENVNFRDLNLNVSVPAQVRTVDPLIKEG